MKLAYLGSGPISQFHIPALRAAGFEIGTAFSRPGSERLRTFCTQNDLRPSRDWEEFLSEVADSAAVVVALKSEAMASALERLAPLGVPIMAEKPGALDRKNLAKLKKLPVGLFCWAYNRRFYETINFARAEADRFVSASVIWPETAKSDHQFIINGCHIVDALRYIFGDLKLVQRLPIGVNSGFVALLQSLDGVPVTINASFGSFTNADVQIFLDDSTVLHLRPLERVNEYSGMKVVEPSSLNRVRSYVPTVASSIDELAGEFKPGFALQAQAFMHLVSTGEYGNLCEFEDGLDSLSLTLELLGR